MGWGSSISSTEWSLTKQWVQKKDWQSNYREHSQTIWTFLSPFHSKSHNFTQMDLRGNWTHDFQCARLGFLLHPPSHWNETRGLQFSQQETSLNKNKTVDKTFSKVYHMVVWSVLFHPLKHARSILNTRVQSDGGPSMLNPIDCIGMLPPSNGSVWLPSTHSI